MLTYYTADVVAFNDYYPYGMLLPNRHGNSSEYRYSFQAQESDDEIKGKGNYINYKYRGYDPRKGRFDAVDPLAPKYPYYSPYSFSGNRVIDAIELEGLEPQVLNGMIIGYKVQSGQGPTQIADDINNPNTQKKYGYHLVNGKINWKDIVMNSYNAREYFPKDISLNRDDPQYRKLNLNMGDIVVINGYNLAYNTMLSLREMYREQLTEAHDELVGKEEYLANLEAKIWALKDEADRVAAEHKETITSGTYEGVNITEFQEPLINADYASKLIDIALKTKRLVDEFEKLEHEVKGLRDRFNEVYYENQGNEEDIKKMENNTQ